MFIARLHLLVNTKMVKVHDLNYYFSNTIILNESLYKSSLIGKMLKVKKTEHRMGKVLIETVYNKVLSFRKNIK